MQDFIDLIEYERQFVYFFGGGGDVICNSFALNVLLRFLPCMISGGYFMGRKDGLNFHHFAVELIQSQETYLIMKN